MREHLIDLVWAFVGIVFAITLLCFDPAHAAQSNSMTLMAIYPLAGGPRYQWTTEAECELYRAMQKSGALFLNDVDLPTQPARGVECQCVSVDDDDQSVFE